MLKEMWQSPGILRQKFLVGEFLLLPLRALSSEQVSHPGDLRVVFLHSAQVATQGLVFSLQIEWRTTKCQSGSKNPRFRLSFCHFHLMCHPSGASPFCFMYYAHKMQPVTSARIRSANTQQQQLLLSIPGCDWLGSSAGAHGSFMDIQIRLVIQYRGQLSHHKQPSFSLNNHLPCSRCPT